MTPPRHATFTTTPSTPTPGALIPERWAARLRTIGFIGYMTVGVAALAFLVR